MNERCAAPSIRTKQPELVNRRRLRRVLLRVVVPLLTVIVTLWPGVIGLLSLPEIRLGLAVRRLIVVGSGLRTVARKLPTVARCDLYRQS
jgi:hypothetical protein